MKIKLLLSVVIAAIVIASPAAAQTTEDPDLRKIVDVLRRLRVSGYIQPQYVRSEAVDEFSVRRGRVKFTYQLTPTSRFVLQPDFSTSGVSLKDGYAELTEPWTGWRHTVTAGQFTWPFGVELVQSSSVREMPERSRVVRTLFPGERDRGVMFSGGGGKRRFDYRLAIVNGTGTAQSFDFNRRKDVVGRAGYSAGPLQAGVSIYRGAELVSLSGLTAGREFEKRRHGVDVQWATPLRGLTVRGEYIQGVQPPRPGTAAASARAPDVEGWYAYFIQNVGARHQFVIRVDGYDPNTGAAFDATRTLGGAYAFRWDSTSKITLAYERPVLEIDDPDDNLLTLRYQFSF